MGKHFIRSEKITSIENFRSRENSGTFRHLYKIYESPIEIA